MNAPEPASMAELTASATDVKAEAVEQQRLLAEIAAAGRLPDWAHKAMLRTYRGMLDDAAPAWIPTAYLRSVKARGAAMFAVPAQLVLVDETPSRWIACPSCQASVAAESEPVRGRAALHGRCQSCAITLCAYIDT